MEFINSKNSECRTLGILECIILEMLSLQLHHCVVISHFESMEFQASRFSKIQIFWSLELWHLTFLSFETLNLWSRGILDSWSLRILEAKKRRNEEQRNGETTKRRNAEMTERRNEETKKRRNEEIMKWRNEETKTRWNDKIKK